MDRHRLGLILACAAVVLAGCVQRTADTPSTPDDTPTTTTTTTSDSPPSPSGYPKPIGERLDAPPGQYNHLDMHVGDVVYVPLDISPGSTQNDESVIVYAADLQDGRYAFQAIAPGETRIVTGESPAGSCGDDEEEDGCTGRPAPPTLDITVTA